MAADPRLVVWRVGRSVGRTIYALTGEGEGLLIGVMDTPELAACAVEAHNQWLNQRGQSFAHLLDEPHFERT
jgi:hypothetical protein